MNKSELVESMADASGLSKADTAKALEAFTSVVTETLKNEGSVALIGFGTFLVKHRVERKGRNPQTGAEITISAANIPSFKAGKSLKDSVK
ncbi:MAG: HU family DNA-binding protein [Methylococcales bacterium]|jgi:DNA-binding protein HU-beta|nr:HU family DNA-binding protein [Methylococcaceae bacterium]HIL40881.1 HU family DNA-binding protein [Methylococcales bacterium]